MKAVKNEGHNQDLSLLSSTKRELHQKKKRARGRVFSDSFVISSSKFRDELHVYLSSASFGNPVMIRLADGRLLILTRA